VNRVIVRQWWVGCVLLLVTWGGLAATTRQPAVAGAFYPRQPRELDQLDFSPATQL
jgi:hypothetical protein